MSAAVKFFHAYYIILSIFMFVQWIIALAAFGYAVESTKRLAEENYIVYRAFARAIAGSAFYEFFVSIFFQIVSFVLYRAVTNGEDQYVQPRADNLALFSFTTSIAILASGCLMNNANVTDVSTQLEGQRGFNEPQKKLLIAVFGYSVWMLLLLWGFIILLLAVKRRLGGKTINYGGNMNNQYSSGAI